MMMSILTFQSSLRFLEIYEDLCVCDICESLGLNQNAVSNQLRILRAHNIVKFEKEGKQARYSLTDLHVEMIYKMGLEHLNE